jgi:hypothetical protein
MFAGTSGDFLVLCLAVLTRGVTLRADSFADVSLFIADLLGIVALISIIEGPNYISTKKCFI